MIISIIIIVVVPSEKFHDVKVRISRFWVAIQSVSFYKHMKISVLFFWWIIIIVRPCNLFPQCKG